MLTNLKILEYIVGARRAHRRPIEGQISRYCVGEESHKDRIPLELRVERQGEQIHCRENPSGNRSQARNERQECRDADKQQAMREEGGQESKV